MPGTTQTVRTQKSPTGLPQQSQLPIVSLQCFAPEVELGLMSLSEMRVALFRAEMIHAYAIVSTVDDMGDCVCVWMLHTALMAEVEQPWRVDGAGVIQWQKRQLPVFGHCQHSFRK